MATLIKSDGTEEKVTPKGKKWTLVELQTHVGGFIEYMPGMKSFKMILDEEGRLSKKPVNLKATEMVRKELIGQYLRYDPVIVGDVLILDKDDKI